MPEADVYVEWVDDEAVALNRRTGELHYLNATAAAVLAFVQEHGLERGPAEAATHFGLSGDEAGEVHEAVDELVARGIVGTVEPLAQRPEPGEPRAPEG